ncbi:MAG TPA: acylphosphatase [Rectinemataceae bacterium]|nr:acylphosphatase [Rectinemataceae bacterium]
MKAIHATVEGEVQGVGFRYSAMREAIALGLTGWVRNAEDGSVELWAEGEESALDEFCRWLGSGPTYARVERVRVTWERARGVYASFSIAP